MKWTDNILHIRKHGVPGECPFCGSSSTDYRYDPPQYAEIGSVFIWCNECKMGMRGSANRTFPRHSADLPEGIIF
jgi:hypothetical protein